MDEMNRWTVLTAVMVLSFVVAAVNTIYYFSFESVVGLVLSALFGFWIVGGCARRGEPLAKWLLHRLPVNITTR